MGIFVATLLLSPVWGLGVAILSLVAFACLMGFVGSPTRRRFGKNLRPGIVGNPGPFADGTAPYNSAAREGKTRETIVGQAHGKYYEAASRGTLFAACEQAAGVAVVASISTTSIFSLYNPVGSGVRLAIKRVAVGYFSGTYGNAGSLVQHCANNSVSQTAPSGGTLLTSQNLDVGNGKGSIGVARTASTVGAPTALYPALVVPINYAGAVGGTPPLQDDDMDGAIVVEPGCSYQIQSTGTATGATSPKVTVAVWWEEVPLI